MSFNQVALIGNPNAGKTTLFNLLTGAKQRTGNWPGVTVDRKEGEFNINGSSYNVVDLPGVYSIDDKNSSMDEQIARDFALNNPDHLYFNIVDASTLERGLYLTTQLRELGINVVVLLNMMDVVRKRGMQINIDQLKQELGCEVISISLKESLDLSVFSNAIDQFKPSSKLVVDYPTEQIQASKDANDDKQVELLEAEARFEQANKFANAVIKHDTNLKKTVSDQVDKLILGSWTGVPFFLVVMYLLFLVSINFGGALIDFFDMAAGTIFIDGTAYVLNSINTPEFITVILADGVGGGIQVVATFIPIIAALYLFLTLLEEVGYMARAAFVMDQFMRKIGLSGKAFIPLIVGFGCNVPGIMAARTLDTHRERITTVLMSPFMSCGARLAVYALFAAAFFPVGGQNIVFALYLIGVLFAIFTGLILKRAFKGGADTSDFLMELPNYQLPSVRNLMINTWNKLKGFIVGAGKIIVLVVTLINVVNSVGVDGSFGHQDSKDSVLSKVAQTLTPVFEPMGIHEDNWPATVGIVTGILAKEVVVGTLDSLYSSIDSEKVAEAEGASEYSLVAGLGEAFATIPANLNDALQNLSDPLGLGVLDDTHSQTLAAETQEVSTATFGAMVSRFDGKIGAFAYLLFILLYFPCVAAFGAMIREVGKTWAVVGGLWATGLAYFSATVFYQVGTFTSHPMSSLLWIGISIGILLASVTMLMRTGKKAKSMVIPITTESNCRHCK
ncbi:MAG: ferrous iron transport protein B [Candidatus Thioglobus sp.]|uniref:ferrous iron transport protein B n=1 Tax=Candidatus Thioglobus sp. TaxID=2026721 RepID=UPI00262FA15C|nr:ferrous iron transport protein B [Candidatus Thioglobus sp.]MDC9726768.1 ferrous iron transport protein B [Candidatus Thioglobus sp.]